MYIDIEDPKGFYDTDQIKLIREAIEFFCDYLLPISAFSELYLTLRIIEGKNYGGSCITYDTKDPREFFVELDGELDSEDTFRTLAHEMVHVKQFVLGELKTKLVNGKPQDTWKRKNFSFDNEDDLLYFAPWEVEAYGMSEGLLYKFFQSRGDL